MVSVLLGSCVILEDIFTSERLLHNQRSLLLDATWWDILKKNRSSNCLQMKRLGQPWLRIFTDTRVFMCLVFFSCLVGRSIVIDSERETQSTWTLSDTTVSQWVLRVFLLHSSSSSRQTSSVGFFSLPENSDINNSWMNSWLGKHPRCTEKMLPAGHTLGLNGSPRSRI